MVNKLTQNWGNVSIKYKILIPVVAIVTVFFLSIHVFVYVSYKDFLLSAVRTQGTQVAEQTANYSEQVFMKIIESFYFLELDSGFKKALMSEEISGDEADILKREFQKVCETLQYVDNVFLCDSNGEIIYNTFRMLDASKNAEDSDWYKLALQNPNKVIWQTANVEKQFKNSPSEIFRIIKNIEKSKNEFVVLVFELNAQLLKRSILNIDECDYANIIVLDTQMNDIFNTKSSFIDDFSDLKEAGITETPELYILQSEIDTNGWRVLYVISKTQAAKGLVNPLFFTVAPMIMLLILFSLILWIFTRWFTKPINKLITLFKRVEDRDFSVVFDTIYSDEIGMLGRAFNKMTSEIHRLIKEIGIIEFAKSRMQLNMLQEQINSHFLYNTLDAAYWEAISGESEKAADIVLNLSQFFRISLNNGEFEISAEREVEQIKRYINILRLRNNGNDRIKVNVSLDESLNDFRMPKLILQPLVENAIVHGVNSKKGGQVDVSIRKDPGYVIIEVTDDGGTMDVDKMYRLLKANMTDSSGKGVAIGNIYERLRYFYGDFAEMLFYCEKGILSRVTIRIKNVLEEE